jgi:transcriptional regulator with XRE-family HTH domain
MQQTDPMENARAAGAPLGLRTEAEAHGKHSERHVLPPELAAELRAARWRRGLSLRQLADKVRVAHGYLCLLEQGKRCPSVAVARELAAALQLDPDVVAPLLAVARPDAGRSWRPPHSVRAAMSNAADLIDPPDTAA